VPATVPRATCALNPTPPILGHNRTSSTPLLPSSCLVLNGEVVLCRVDFCSHVLHHHRRHPRMHTSDRALVHAVGTSHSLTCSGRVLQCVPRRWHNLKISFGHSHLPSPSLRRLTHPPTARHSAPISTITGTTRSSRSCTKATSSISTSAVPLSSRGWSPVPFSLVSSLDRALRRVGGSLCVAAP
jgi:hypothetical protein